MHFYTFFAKRPLKYLYNFMISLNLTLSKEDFDKNLLFNYEGALNNRQDEL